MGFDFLELGVVFLVMHELPDAHIGHLNSFLVVLGCNEELSILEVEVGDVIVADPGRLIVLLVLVHQAGLRQVHDRDDILRVGPHKERVLGETLILDQILEDAVELGNFF